MKLNARAIQDFLRVPDKTAHGALVYGPDEGLARERLRALLKQLLPDARDPFALTELNEARVKDDPACVHDACAELSFGGGRRVIVLRDASDACAGAVEAALPVMDAQHYLLVLSGELGPRSKLRLLFEQQPKLASLPCYHDEAVDIAQLIRAKLEAASVRVEAGVMEFLTTQLGNDRGVTQAELDKLLLYMGEEKTLTLAQARTVIGHSREAGMEALAFALAAQDSAGLDAELALALREGMQPVALLRAVQRHFQKLYGLRAQVARGLSAEQAVAQLKPPVFFRHAPLLARQAQRWSQAAIGEALRLLTEAELSCKQGASPALICGRALHRIAKLSLTRLETAA